MMRARGLAVAVLGAASAVGSGAAPGTVLSAEVDDPRAFGYQVGDLVSRTVTVHSPDGLVLDQQALPRPGAHGKALELRGIALRQSSDAGGRRHELRLEYQVFLSPPEPRTLEMPAFTLHFQGRPRDQDVRIEAWPVTVSPLAPAAALARRGLGELQPDRPPPLIDTVPGQIRLTAYAGVALVLLAYLGQVYLALPWWSRRQRPFTRAWRAVRTLPRQGSVAQWRAALQRIHDALNETAGEVVFEHRLARFIAARPRFEPLRDELATFFEHSRREFFGSAAEGTGDAPWLLGLCRKCRDAERGSA